MKECARALEAAICENEGTDSGIKFILILRLGRVGLDCTFLSDLKKGAASPMTLARMADLLARSPGDIRKPGIHKRPRRFVNAQCWSELKEMAGRTIVSEQACRQLSPTR